MIKRRNFLASLLSTAALPVLAGMPVSKIKLSLNVFSFNDPLLKGTMTLDEVIDFCAEVGFEGLDITGYYFKGYPEAPSDELIYHVKRRVFASGMEISGTGVRNDFTIADKIKRQAEVDLVKRWVEVAAKLGAPVLRIFAGTQKNEGIPEEKVTEWMLKDIQTCVDFGKQHGVVIGLQNHADFLKTAGQIVKIVETINSPWFGIILDTGSYRMADPYEEIVRSVKYAVNWQLKEKIFINGAEVETDVRRVIEIIKSSNYRGYVPIETLGEGDPKVKIKALLERVKKEL
ncbi:MAG TPA: sugar phosphate isomerase/epimerase family protein [Cyclobacteriaceae bacterium]|nr:sugar phosphate isomerase/epimerase family protein [Cyclobacteriaceae bacterium]